MRLVNAVKVVSVNIGGDIFTLTPSLRAAYLLATREGSFEALLKQLSENSVTAMFDVLAAASGNEAARSFMNAVSARPLSKIIFDADAEFGLSLEPPTPLNETLIGYLLALLDIRLDENRTVSPNASASAAKHETDFPKILEHLFEIATGWLGWTPQDTWDAAPAEIVSAHRGRIALLKAIFGFKDKVNNDNEPKEPDFTRDPNAGAKLLALKASGF